MLFGQRAFRLFAPGSIRRGRAQGGEGKALRKGCKENSLLIKSQAVNKEILGG
ncbi:hypothetical protein GCWU000341_00090 [Oribacterium sp. oral taxon 078 str. F0262]|nr:hypothetical protein GCWU000341_00090 [Oribacterium sp. oral taxon 078 str. F0262]